MKIIKNILIFVVIVCSLCYVLESIIDGNLYKVLIQLSIIPVIFLPEILRKTFKFKISFISEIIYIIFVFMAHFLGSILNLYNKIEWYDNLMHFLSGSVVSIFSLGLLIRFKKYDEKSIVFTIIFILGISFIISGLWEYFEFISDRLFGKDAQMVLKTGVSDTMIDMILSTLGSSLVLISYSYEIICNKKFLVQKFIKQIL